LYHLGHELKISRKFLVQAITNCIKGHNDDITFSSLLKFLTLWPFYLCYQKIYLEPYMRSLIQFVKKGQDFYRVKISSFNNIIFLPPDDNFLFQFYNEMLALLDKKSDHYYEKCITPVNYNDVVVDCGAGEGLFSLSILHRCRKIFAIEPHPILAECLRRTFSNNSSVAVLEVGLSDKIGKSRFICQGAASRISDDQGDVMISLSTIDDLFFNRGIQIDFLKADLEGHEINMLKGAKNTICAYRPKIAVTTYHYPHDARKIKEFLMGLDIGYKIKTYGLVVEDVDGNTHNENWPVMLHAWVNKNCN